MKSVYIVLSQTGTAFSRAIQFCTKDPYNHASISFNISLQEMYSFGRKTRYNLLTSGFVKENFHRGIYAFFPASRCCVLEVAVTDKEYAAMLQTAEGFIKNEKQYRYNLIGVIGSGVGIRVLRSRHFFCSQFVSYLLNRAEFWNREPELTRPMDFFREIPHKRLVFEGNILDYPSFCAAQTMLDARKIHN